MYQVTLSAPNTISCLNGGIEKIGDSTRKIGNNIFSKSDIAFIDANGVTLVGGGMSLTFVAKAVKESDASWNFVAEDGTKSTLFKGKGIVVQIVELSDSDDDSSDDDDDEKPTKGKKGGKAKPATKGKKAQVADEDDDDSSDDDEDDDDSSDDDEDDEDDEDEMPKRGKKGGKAKPEPKGKKGKTVDASSFDWDD